MRYEDLNPKMRRLVDAQEARERAAGNPPRRKRTSKQITGPCDYRCHECGLVSPSWGKAETHARESGHGRQDMVLPDPAGSTE